MTRLGLGLMVGMYNNSVSDSIEARTINELLDLPAISLDFNPQSLYPAIMSITERSANIFANKPGFFINEDCSHTPKLFINTS